ncbi:MAG: alpha-ketoacid dehydrogenase subunit beta [Deltaproteobacteria bacterium]|nr:alpha-ketoacid dehydrogenase subunit beta [Deltaproteobacteria bacterium]MBI2231744.1 alpha-ketoacid dehydrogenase subunit beta [Deltaproteobacteria bacterium]MBI2534117.1 alpha-ketoacid dehydrogenase subunit beta [Deltaproteobacteria bacterium]MBI3065894.1 alpha-ketoacid dehydrogenase subunit beta [Deltaproteobacteria bacterium]
MAKLTMVEAINLALRQEMEKDPRVLLLGEDVGRNGGVFRVTQGLLDTFGETRVMDTPLSESAIVGVAIGMAVYGLRPVAEIQFEGFVYAAMEQLADHAGRIRTRSRGRYHCPLVVRLPYGGGIRAPEHHSDSNEAYFVHTPGIKVVVPSTPYEAKGLFVAALRDPDPVIFMEPKKIYRSLREEVPEEEYLIPLGESRIVLEGTDITLITWGAMLQPTLQAAMLMEKSGTSAEVLDLRTLSPLDTESMIESVKKTHRAVVVHEAPATCGVGAEIVARINEKALVHLEAPVERVTGFDTVMPLPKLEKYYLPSAERVVDAVNRVISF